jgi:23S rRNA (uracil1939-C5)-methyltransferase
MATPLCPYYGTCNGCSAQHIDYKQQLNNKKQWIVKALNFPYVEVFHDREYNYRNRMDFIFKKGRIGLRSNENPNELVDIENCVIAEPRINELLGEVRTFFKNHPLLKEELFYYLVIRNTSLGEASLSFVLNDNSTKLGEAQELIREFAKTSSAKNILITYTNPEEDESISEEFFTIKGTDQLQEKYLGKIFFYSVQGFSQNNTIMANKMHEYVRKLLEKYSNKQAYLLDLYAGVGTFGILNADLFKEVNIVESFAPCIETAKVNLQENQVKNAHTFVLDARNIVRLKLKTPLFVVTDPPRVGMDEKTIQELKRLKPEAIVYISCNHHQLSRDIPKFKEYEVKSAAIFDLFPQTAHLEVVVELIRKEK